MPFPDPKSAIRAQALALGFDQVGFADVSADWLAGDRLLQFIAQGRHGTMDWFEETAGRRVHPRALWPDARTAIVLGLNYGPDRDPRLALQDRTRGAISVYAQGDDYHDLIKKRLKALGRWMAATYRAELKVFVDTAPLMEKPLAQAAGLGWQGRHTNLVSRAFGSWLFLGAVLSTLEIAPDPPAGDACGSCSACMAACPTDAFPAPYQLDARRCLSYLTIEHRGPIPIEFRAAMGARIYGCDDCLAACPWNKFAATAREQAFHARDSLRAPALAELARLDDAAFRALFAKSPVKRIGRARFLRNVLYAIGNSGDAALAVEARALLDDGAPEVRGAAVWALSRLLPTAELARLAEGLRESDPEVLAEWAACAQPCSPPNALARKGTTR